MTRAPHNWTARNNRHWLTDTLFAHRGLHDCTMSIVENSMSAFKAAIDNGSGIELDVQLTADNRAVVFHDASLDRLTDRSGKVADLTLTDLEKIALKDSTDQIASLETVIEMVAGRVPVLVEIKADSHKPDTAHRLERAVSRTLNAATKRMHQTIAIMSFSPRIVAWFRDHDPQRMRGLVASTRYRRELGIRLSTPPAHARMAVDLDVDFVAYDVRSLPNAFTMDWRRSGAPLLTWTVRTERHRRLARRFSDTIIFEAP